MHEFMKPIFLILGIVFILLFFPMLLTGIHDLATDVETDANLAITGTPPAGEVTLTNDPYDEDINSVLSLVGNGTEEAGAITAVSYVAPTLNVTGITDSTTLTAKYEKDATGEYTGFLPILKMTPLLVLVACFFMAIAGLYTGVKAFRR